jgi:hypothetical protein
MLGILLVSSAVGQMIYYGKAFDPLPSSGLGWTFVGTWVLIHLALFVFRRMDERTLDV